MKLFEGNIIVWEKEIFVIMYEDDSFITYGYEENVEGVLWVSIT